jgi:hypothetical protein
MKNIYRLLTGVIVMLITITGMSLHAGAPSLPSPHDPAFALFPPTNLTVEDWGCSGAFLSWNKPKNTGGVTPLGLIGYRIYCDGHLICYLSEPDTLDYLDPIDIDGAYKDSVTAYYDLTVYGYPGQYGESTGTVSTYIIVCSSILPFSEPWDLASFSFQEWTFSPSKGNWGINTSQGDPLPTAAFRGTPALTDYDYTLESVPLDCSQYTCANIYLDFDFSVIVNNPTSQEKLITELYYDFAWHPKDTLVNSISMGWVHHRVDISEAVLKDPRIGFRATGSNSADIVEWDVDNINIYAVCYKPPDFTLIRKDNVVHLSWGIPCSGKQLKPNQVNSSILVGYNVYRTGSDSLPPYVKLTPSPLSINDYFDTIPLATGKYCYYVTAAYQDSYFQGIDLCEPSSDTLCVHYTYGIPEKNEPRIHIYPNPVSDMLNIESGLSFNSIEIMNLVGEKVYSETFPSTQKFSLPFTAYNAGIYLLKITLKDKTIVMKVQKNER